MARKASTKTPPVTITPATRTEARKWLLANQDSLPDGISVGVRGRLSNAAQAYFTEKTGQPIVAA